MAILRLLPLRGTVSASDTYRGTENHRLFVAYYLPVLAAVIGGFARPDADENSFLDEVRKRYVVAARAKGVK